MSVSAEFGGWPWVVLMILRSSIAFNIVLVGYHVPPIMLFNADLVRREVVRTLTSADTPGLHNKIPAYKIFARGWVAQKSFCS